MLLGHIHTPETYQPFLNHPVWKKILKWLNTEAPKLADGEYEIDGRNIYAPISTIATMAREKTKYEAHHEYIDVHYCLDGGEIIEWAPVEQLTPTMPFNTEKDYCLYESPEKATSLTMAPGNFAIFFPADAHMPKISDGQYEKVKKVVVKIKKDIL